MDMNCTIAHSVETIQLSLPCKYWHCRRHHKLPIATEVVSLKGGMRSYLDAQLFVSVQILL